MSAGSPTGRYLFAVARGLDELSLGSVPGLRDRPVEIVSHRDLQAVVCTVDLEEFGEAALARNLEDLAWLEMVARAHNEVVFAAASSAAVAPMRLVTICSDDDSLATRIEALYDDLVEALDRVEGRAEWSVKAYAVSEPAVAAEPVTTPDAAPVSGAGAAYLQRKKQQAEHRRSSSEQTARQGEEVHADLSALAVAARRLPPQDPRLTGRHDTMLLNGAYLVDIEAATQFREAVEHAGQEHPGVTLEVEGPWPPYSFATLE